DDRTDPCPALPDRRKHDRRREETLVPEALRELDRLGLLPRDDGRDGRLAYTRVEAEVLQSAFERARVRPQALDALGLVAQDVECREAGRHDRRRRACGEQVRPAAVDEPLDE